MALDDLPRHEGGFDRVAQGRCRPEADREQEGQK
jgi:hypothetical protein